MSECTVQKPRKNRWVLLRNVIKAIYLFRTHEVTLHSDLNSLLSEIDQFPKDSSPKPFSEFALALLDSRREFRVFECACRGTPHDLKQLQEDLEEDVYAKYISNSHPLSLLNRRNFQGQTLLYVAAKHGLLQVVKLLVQKGADHRVSSVLENETETALEVAARWGYVDVFRFLVLNLEWEPQVIERCAQLKPCVARLVKQLRKKSCFGYLVCKY